MSTLSRVLRLAPRSEFGKFFTNNSQLGMLQVVRPVTLRVEQAQTIPLSDHDEKNMNLKRPMSPHLTIYAPEIQSIMSISHRIAGATMGTYLISFGIATLVLPQDFSTYIAAIEAMDLPQPLLYAVRFCMVIPFTYHGINGLRHLIWDVSGFLGIKQVKIGGYFLAFLAPFLALGLAGP